MKFKKYILAILVVFVGIGSMGCSREQKGGKIELNMFDMRQGIDVSTNYLKNISIGNIEGANMLCSPELVNSNKELGTGVSNVTAFSMDSTVEGNSFGYFIFNVIRSSGIEPKSDLENFIIKVEKNKNDYKVTEVKAKSQKELYVKGNGLRIVGDEGGKSNLIVSLNNIPKDTYLRENKIMLYKDKVPNESFGKVALSFTGKRIAITTTDNKDSYVCIAFIDEALMTMSDVTGEGAEAATPSGLEELQQAIEKSIAKKIVSIDLFKGCKINRFVFSNDEDVIDVEYTNKYNANRVSLYKTDDGNIIDTKINDIFPEDKYSISKGSFEEEEFKFKVVAIDGVKDFDNELIGEYSLDLLSLEINKL